MRTDDVHMLLIDPRDLNTGGDAPGAAYDRGTGTRSASVLVVVARHAGRNEVVYIDSGPCTAN